MCREGKPTNSCVSRKGPSLPYGSLFLCGSGRPGKQPCKPREEALTPGTGGVSEVFLTCGLNTKACKC